MELKTGRVSLEVTLATSPFRHLFVRPAVLIRTLLCARFSMRHHHEGLKKHAVQFGEQASVQWGSLRFAVVPPLNGQRKFCFIFIKKKTTGALPWKTGSSAQPRTEKNELRDLGILHASGYLG